VLLPLTIPEQSQPKAQLILSSLQFLMRQAQQLPLTRNNHSSDKTRWKILNKIQKRYYSVFQLFLMLSSSCNRHLIRSEHQIDNSKQTIILVIVLLDRGNTKKTITEGLLPKKRSNLACKCRQISKLTRGKTSSNL